MSTLDAYRGKYNRDKRENLCHLFTVCWDKDKDFNHCRICKKKFSFLRWKHHCRNCGGIHCNKCAPSGSYISSELQKRRSTITDSPEVFMTMESTADEYPLCLHCRCGETPGERLRLVLVKEYLDPDRKKETIHRRSTRVKAVKLYAGSLYDHSMGRTRLKNEFSGIAHLNGYFELTNDEDCPTAVKVLESGSDVFNESTKAYFTILRKGESVYAVLDPDCHHIDVISLLAPVRTKYIDDSSLLKPASDCQSSGQEDPAVMVPDFTRISIHTICCANRNVLLRQTGGAPLLQPLAGRRAKAWKQLDRGADKLLGSRYQPDNRLLDFTTNVQQHDVAEFFSYRSTLIDSRIIRASTL